MLIHKWDTSKEVLPADLHLLIPVLPMLFPRGSPLGSHARSVGPPFPESLGPTLHSPVIKVIAGCGCIGLPSFQPFPEDEPVRKIVREVASALLDGGGRPRWEQGFSGPRQHPFRSARQRRS